MSNIDERVKSIVVKQLSVKEEEDVKAVWLIAIVGIIYLYTLI